MGSEPTKQLSPKGSYYPITVIEEARQNKRMIDRAVRRVERERKKMAATEKKYLTEIKALAKQNKHV